jgi:heme A synthase
MHALARGATALAFVLLVAGSLVHQTGASLACPDWPLCNGTAFPTMRGGIAFEHTHRLIALALVLVTVMLVIAARRHRDRGVRIATMACAGLIVAQAALGATTVLLRLPPAVSVAHLGTAMTLLGALAWIAGRTSAAGAIPPARYGGAIALVLLQCVLGALVRHTGAALACHGFPLCNGAVWPDGSLARLQMAHRAVAVLVFVQLLLIAIRGVRAGGSHFAWMPCALPFGLALLQIGLGIAVVQSGARFELVTLHHAMAAAIALSLGFAFGKSTAPWHDSAHAPARDRRSEGAAKLDPT